MLECLERLSPLLSAHTMIKAKELWTTLLRYTSEVDAIYLAAQGLHVCWQSSLHHSLWGKKSFSTDTIESYGYKLLLTPDQRRQGPLKDHTVAEPHHGPQATQNLRMAQK